MKNLKAKLRKNGGFTLIEMLIVVAIIAILIAVSIPLVNGALEKARDATDQANERAAKAEAALVYLGVTDNMPAGYIAGSEFTGTLYYDAQNGTMVTDKAPAGYGKCTDTNHLKTANVTYPDDGSNVDAYLTVTWDANGKVSLTWAK